MMLITRPQRIHADNKYCDEFENISLNISLPKRKKTLYKFYKNSKILNDAYYQTPENTCR